MIAGFYFASSVGDSPIDSTGENTTWEALKSLSGNSTPPTKMKKVLIAVAFVVVVVAVVFRVAPVRKLVLGAE